MYMYVTILVYVHLTCLRFYYLFGDARVKVQQPMIQCIDMCVCVYADLKIELIVSRTIPRVACFVCDVISGSSLQARKND